MCSQCGKVLEEGGFFEEKGAIFCPPCYDVRYAPSCAKCKKKITGVSGAGGWAGQGGEGESDLSAWESTVEELLGLGALSSGVLDPQHLNRQDAILASFCLSQDPLHQ